MKVLISGGGTGGHIYPGLALADAIVKEFEEAKIVFVGTATGLEADIIPKAGYELKIISVQGLPRKISIKLFQSLLKSGKGMLEARNIIKEYKPDIVIGTGGYVCGPILLIASLMKVPTLIHEQNAYPGITNKILGRFVDRVAISNIDAKKYFSNPEKVVLTGNPIREDILDKDKKEALVELNLNAKQKVILVFGGSRGAKSINQAIVDIYDRIREDGIQILHITGKRDFEHITGQAKALGIKNIDSGQIIIKPYLYNMSSALAVADIVISRAGATGLAEITACGIPSILIPYPHAAEDHQYYNAQSLERNGAAFVVRDNQVNGDKLYELINEIFQSEDKLEEMAKKSKSLGQPRAVGNLLALVNELLKN